MSNVIDDILIQGVQVNLDIDGDLFRTGVLLPLEEDRLYVSMPTSRGEPVMMAKSQEVYLLCDLPDDMLLLCMLSYREEETINGVQAAAFDMLRWDIRDSFRKTFRLRISKWCAFSVLSLYEPSLVEFSDQVSMFDLSEGGVCLITTFRAPANAFAECSFEVESEVMTIMSRVVHCDKMRQHGHFHLGLEFIELTLDQRRKIRKYIYAEQAKRIKRT
ncbi:MAG: PilZ domain-containing protein [Eubacteriales bacterium]|nr:PilZ domain-containing protein [Eubacteriales bacterium]